MNEKNSDSMGPKDDAIAVIDKRASSLAPSAPIGSTPSDLIRVALERGATIEQMGQLIALQERMEATEARKAFVAAMAAFKADGPLVITKDGEVDFKTDKGRTHYRHETIGNVLRVVTPRLAEHGLSHGWVVRQDVKSQEITVDCVLTHLAGHAEVVTLTGPLDKSGNKNALQSIGSTVSYLKRYTLLAALGLASDDEDDDAGAGQKTRAQAKSKDEPPAPEPPSEDPKPKGQALPERAARAIKAYERFAVSQADMERAFSKPATAWDTTEFEQLQGCWRELEELPAKARAAKAREFFPPISVGREPGQEG